MMKLNDFIKALKKAEKSKTLYVLGCFGAPLNDKNKKRYTNNKTFNKQREKLINAQSSDVFGFDCICLVKGIIGRWNADKEHNYGGTQVYSGRYGLEYGPERMPDYGADTIFTKRYVYGVSRDFSRIKPGALLHMPGHVGVYIGCGQVIECTPKWKNCVQVTYLGNIPEYRTGNYRIWTEYGYLPCVDYSDGVKEVPVKEKEAEPVHTTHTVVPKDNLTKIAALYNTTVDSIVEKNIKKYPRITRNYIVVGWVLEV